MISIGDHLDVPQYMAHPWFITWVKDRTISAKKKPYNKIKP